MPGKVIYKIAKSDKKFAREARLKPDWGDGPSFDCGLGLYLTKNAGQVYYGLPEKLRDNFDKFLDYLIGPYPDIYEVRAKPGYHSYKDDVLQILYHVKECTHPDVKCLFTIEEITVI
jgi:hypothetical protein